MKRPLLIALLMGAWASPAYALIASTSASDVALGTDSSAIGSNDIAINSSANGMNNTAIGGTIENYGLSLATGGTNAASGGTASNGGSGYDEGNTAYGADATASNEAGFLAPSQGATAIGTDAHSINASTAIGSNAQAGSANSDTPSLNNEDTAIGYGSRVYNASYATAIGGASASGQGTIAEGVDARAAGDGSIAIGNDALSSNSPGDLLDPTTAVGSDASATGTDADAFGANSTASGNYSAALGTGATVDDNNSVALGANSTANTAPTSTSSVTIRGNTYQVAGGTASGTVSVGSSGANGGTPMDRTITNVAAGQISSTSTDAVNGSELYATNQALDNLQTTQSSTGVLHYTNGSGGASSTPTNTASAGTSGTGPVVISNVGNGAVAPGSTDAVNGGQLYSAEQGAQAEANQAQANAEGYAGQVAGQDSTAALQAANQHSDNLFTLTCHRTGDGSGDIVCGRDAQVSGQDSSAQGTGALANGTGANAYGANTQAVGDGATAIGNSAIAEGVSTTALGDHAEAAAPNSTALGENSAALGVESTAIGYGSVANRPNSVSVGNAAAGIDRQITNVAAGTQPHDAVNLQQFQDGLQGANAEADKVGSVDASLGEAAAQAAAGMGNNTVSGAVADYNGQSSFAFSYQHRFGYHWTGDVTVASNGGAGNTVAAAGAGYSW